MKTLFSLIFLLSSFSICAAQSAGVQPTPSRPRTVAPAQPTTNFAAPAATPVPNVIVTNNMPPPAASSPRSAATPVPTPIVSPSPIYPASTPAATTTLPLPAAYKNLTLGQLRGKIAEARRLMQTRPMPTALTSSFPATDIVRLAYYNWKTTQVDFVTLTKTVFLARDAELATLSQNGKPVRVRILRANGVNTAVVIYDEYNLPQTPLIVQYPIEKFGSFREMAYYISAHPGIVTPEVVSAGQLYVRNTIDIARQKLQEKGIFISPQIADIAERLATVEHVDHQRFWTEYHPNLYNEIFALYALNEGNTYNYSVSSAGAGGMVQMIAPTYRMVRDRYFNVGLNPDFVAGMRNHVNAAQAMLLYMQMTWNDLSASDTVLTAISTGTATQAELMAAGYNSNPARLPGYIKRGGANWRSLIPRETKIYLQIYSSLQGAVPMTPRTK